MPEENKIIQDDPKVDIDTSGPEVDVALPEEKKAEIETVETEQETIKEVTKEEPAKEESAKEKAGKKIVKSMGDKKRYDATNQLKTLIVMQVLADSKSFFQSQKLLEDRQDFFNDAVLADGEINYNLMGQYLLFVGSDGLHNEMVESQWRN